jgi:MarR-like DNA-binding transcriptional regulator SgrR of sgrS sRNA
MISCALLLGVASRPAAAFLPPPYGGVITAPLPDQVVTLDPARAGRESELQVISLLFDSLYTLLPRGVPRPHLVEPNPEVSADGKSWRFQLRSNVRLSNGKILVAPDVVASLRRLKTGPHGYLIAPVRAVEADGPGSVVLRLWRKCPGLPWLLAAPSSGIAVPAATPRGGRATVLVGTGPFRLHAQSAGAIHLRAHLGHFSGRPYLDEVRFIVFDRASAEVATFQVGGIQVSLRGTSVFGGRPRNATAESESPIVTPVFLGVGRGQPLLADAAFRLALLRGIDRRRLGRLVGMGRTEGADSPVPRHLLRLQPRPIGFDRMAAGRILGRLAGPRETLRSEAARGRIKLSLLVDASRFEDAVVAGQIVADLDQLGIAATVEAKPAAEYQGRLEEGRYELVLGRMPVQVPLASAVLARALALSGDRPAAQRCIASGTCGAKEAAGFMRRLQLLPLVHASTRVFYDARLGALRLASSTFIPYADLYWARRSP